MESLPQANEISKKYCGGGHGGYALYMFENSDERDRFIKNNKGFKIEPYTK